MLSALFTVIFGFSLLPGRKPVCLAIAERTLQKFMKKIGYVAK